MCNNARMKLIEQGVENGGGDVLDIPAHQDRLVLLGSVPTSHGHEVGQGHPRVTVVAL